ncbi:MAG: hypothetical protein ABSD28_04915 [Tepidisphaeraceae bacterium]|jgi:hypothetical protein
MNKLTTIERAQIPTALVEGVSISATARMFSVSKITILRLLADAGTLAEQYHDLTVCDLATKRVQVDEIWSFVHAKNKNVQDTDWGKGYGDCSTCVALLPLQLRPRSPDDQDDASRSSERRQQGLDDGGFRGIAGTGRTAFGRSADG